jgi:integrase
MSCVCPRRDIRWRARHGQGRNEVSRTFASEQEARTWLATVVADQARGLYVDHRDGRRLIKDWAAEWKAAQLHSANTAARVSWAIDVHIAPHFGQLPIGRLTRLRVQTWIRSLEALGYAPETIASLYSVLGSVMAAAVDEGLIPATPCRRVQLPRNDRPERPFIDETEGLRVAEACGSRTEQLGSAAAYGLLVVTALFTGLRWGELVGLRRENCQLLHKRIRVVESLHETAGALSMGPPKTAASRRDVLLPPFLVDLLAEHLSTLRTESSSTGSTLPPGTRPQTSDARSSRPQFDGSDLVFAGARGAPLRRSNFARRIWQPALLAAKVNPKLHVHDLRGSHKALLLADGVPEFAIDMRLGHARRGVRDQYSHVLPTVEKRMLESLQARWEQAQEKRRAG